MVNLCIYVYIFFGYMTVSSPWQIDFLIPKWARTISDDNLTNIPKHIIQLQNNVYYPMRLFLQNMFNSQHQMEKTRKLQRTQNRVQKSSPFFCNITGTRSFTRPTSVHELRPGDIDIVGAVGDSLTAGTGSFAYILPQIVVEHRGSSWTAGGQNTWKEFLTIPNIIKVFNPNLIGYAYGDSLPEQKFSQFNVAEPGALSRDIPFMTKELVKRIQMDKRVNLNKDWKLISLMMSSNTFCIELCYDDYMLFAERHRKELIEALLYIKKHLPRTIVNLISSPNLKTLINFTNLPPLCFITHLLECPCLYATQYKNKLPDYIKVMEQFKIIEKEIVEMEEFKNKDDFAVVLQTFTEHLNFPVNRFNTTDLSYLSLDCFHLSQKGYARAANALWNNMMEPVGKKSTNWIKEFDRFICPTEESPFIRTWKNSIT